MTAVRMLAGLVAGFACAASIAALGFAALQAAWPAYAAAAPMRAYTLPMLWTRLAIAALLSVASGAAAVAVARDARAGWVLGALFVLVSLPSHLYFVWAEYPPWYHAVYLLSLVPLTGWGGRLVSRRLARSATASTGAGPA